MKFQIVMAVALGTLPLAKSEAARVQVVPRSSTEVHVSEQPSAATPATEEAAAPEPTPSPTVGTTTWGRTSVRPRRNREVYAQGSATTPPAPSRSYSPGSFSSSLNASSRVSPEPTRVVRRSDRRSGPPSARAAERDFSVIRRLDQARSSRVNVVPGRPTWHTVNGRRYTHYWNGDVHWYGFYNRSHFYWSRYHANRWWCYDPAFQHWAFWWSGYWWWPGPAGVTYVYVNDSYVPYETSGVAVARPESTPPPNDVPPAPVEDQDQTVNSPDGKRMVQIVGSKSEAFLYDTSSGHSVYIKLLASDVEQVRFSGGTGSDPLRILVDFEDGHFSFYDAQGNLINP